MADQIIIATNARTFDQSFHSLDAEMGTGYDLTNIDIAFSIIDLQSNASALSATIGDGVTVDIVAEGWWSVVFTADQMGGLDAKEYEGRRTFTSADGYVSEAFYRISVREGLM